MHDDFKSITEVLNHNKEVTVIDILSHVMSLDEDPYLKALVPPAEGIYLLGSIDPILYKDRMYYEMKTGKSIEFAKILKINDDIVDETGRIIVSLKDLKTKARFFKHEPSVPSVGIKIAIAVVTRYLGTLCRHTRHVHDRIRIDKYVRPEYQEMVDKEEFVHGFERLLDLVTDFVGRDTWNIYFYKLRGTSLVIEKSVDWRVYRYYETRFEEENRLADE